MSKAEIHIRQLMEENNIAVSVKQADVKNQPLCCGLGRRIAERYKTRKWDRVFRPE